MNLQNGKTSFEGTVCIGMTLVFQGSKLDAVLVLSKGETSTFEFMLRAPTNAGFPVGDLLKHFGKYLARMFTFQV